jgi:DNA-directed RNA polymerase specialized sigma24 family protein
VKIAVHKLQKSVAYHTAKRRDFREEASLESELADEYAGVTAQDSAAALVAELDELLASLQGREVEIVRLCLQGHSTPEIGVRVGCSRWTVRRVLDLAGTRLVKRLAADQACPVNAQDP